MIGVITTGFTALWVTGKKRKIQSENVILTGLELATFHTENLRHRLKVHAKPVIMYLKQ